MILANFLGIAGVIVVGLDGTVVGGVSGPGPVDGGGAGSEAPLDPGGVTVPRTSFGPVAAQASVRKVKNLPAGLRPTEADVDMVTESGAAGLKR
jgi:hypothetical protein